MTQSDDLEGVTLEPGDVLSYSAGSTQCGPLGFRKLHPRPSLLGAAIERWPAIGQMIGDRLLMLINAYPATVGAVSSGVTVDTYLSPRIMSRALQLGALTRKPVALCGQPLFLADALLSHLRAERPLPDTLLLLVGGYVTPRSLERMLLARLGAEVEQVTIIQGYGAAEVDAGCMMAYERDSTGQLVYYPRRDVEPELDDEGRLRLSIRGPDGQRLVDRFATGERAEPRPGGGWVLWNDERLHPIVRDELESWTDEQWHRRTGYVRRDGETVWIQLRQGHEPQSERELDHWDFGREHGFSWLDKPYWR